MCISATLWFLTALFGWLATPSQRWQLLNKSTSKAESYSIVIVHYWITYSVFCCCNGWDFLNFQTKNYKFYYIHDIHWEQGKNFVKPNFTNDFKQIFVWGSHVGSMRIACGFYYVIFWWEFYQEFDETFYKLEQKIDLGQFSLSEEILIISNIYVLSDIKYGHVIMFLS